MTEEELLDFLMTSEFESDISPDEFRFLLSRWRYFYRVMHGRLERTRQDLTYEADRLRADLDSAEMGRLAAQMECARKDDIIHSLKNRKLTFRERWTGKITTKEDEDK